MFACFSTAGLRALVRWSGDIMEYKDSPECAQDLATKALTFLGEMGLVPIPHNYTIAYSFFSGNRPELNGEIEKLIAAGGIAASEMTQLYDTFFGLEPEAVALRSAGEMLEGIIANLRQTVVDAGDGVAGYGKILKDFSNKVEAGRINAEDLVGAINSILDETQKVGLRNTDLEKQFAETGEEVTQLRRNLDKMRIAANTDSLTGLANRKHFDARFNEFLKRASNRGEPLTMLMADIDHFKKFNDEFGHQVGDHVLRLVSVAISQAVRGGDFVARYGGEEFVVVLPRTGLDGALAVAENIRQAIASKRLTRKSTGEALGMITLSLGAALYRLDETAGRVIKRADEALYRAKRGGRNRVESEEFMGDYRRLTSAAQ